MSEDEIDWCVQYSQGCPKSSSPLYRPSAHKYHRHLRQRPTVPPPPLYIFEGSYPLVSRIRWDCWLSLEPHDIVGHVVVHLSVVQIRNREPQTSIFDECLDRMPVDVDTRLIAPTAWCPRRRNSGGLTTRAHPD